MLIPMSSSATQFSLRLAREEDVAALEKLIELSVRQLLSRHYSTAQLEAAIGPVFGVDRQLIRDGTYFVVGHGTEIVGCGGWSKRKAVYGGDRERDGEDGELDPTRDAARVRAFFVHPDWERCGLGRMLLLASEAAIRQAGFARVELCATLAGEPLYAAFGYAVTKRYDAPMPGGLSIAVVAMRKDFPPR